MNQYQIVLLTACKQSEENKAYYRNVLTKLWEELSSCIYHEEEPNSDFPHNGLPQELFNSCKLLFRLVFPDKLKKNEGSIEKENEENQNQYCAKENWINLSEDYHQDLSLKTLLARIEEFSNNCTVADQEKSIEGYWSDNVAEQLHKIADQLPCSGYILKIYWLICGHSECVDISKNIPLYGALKRLHTWNSACITWVFDSVDEQCNYYLHESWNKELDITLTSVQDTVEPLANTNIVWHGSLVSPEDQQTTQVNHNDDWQLSKACNLASWKITMTDFNRNADCESKIDISKGEKEMLANSIKVICELSRCCIPLWKTFPYRFILYHKTLLKRVFEIEKLSNMNSGFELNDKMKETVLLASLESCHVINEMRKHCTEDWIEFVKTGEHNSVLDEARESTKPIETFYLLLYPLEPGIFVVYFLRPEKSICDLHSRLSIYGASFPVEKPAERAIDELRKAVVRLPQVSVESFAKWMKEFHEVYFRSLRKRLSNVDVKVKNEEKPCLSTSELWEILLTIYSETAKECSLSNNVFASEEQIPQSDCLSPCISEHVPPFDQKPWPERRWLKWLDTINGTAASPLKSQWSLAVYLDPTEMLKHFTKDGKPRKKELEALRKQIEEKRKNWPTKQEDVAKSRETAIGIDYCTDSSNTPCMHSFSPKLLPRHVKYETLSICNTPKTLAKAKLEGMKRKSVQESSNQNKTDGASETNIQVSSCKQVEPAGIKENKAKFALKESSAHTSKASSAKANEDSSKRTKKHKTADAKKVKLRKEKRRSFDGSETIVPSGSNSNVKEKRSDRHKRRLARVVKRSLTKYGIDPTADYYETCCERLYYLCKSFLKDLRTSEGLNNEMKRLADSNVANVVEFEKRRQATKLTGNKS